MANNFFEYEEEDEEPIQHFGIAPPAFIFIVDCSPCLLKDGLLNTLEIIRNGIRSHIFHSTTCYCSIILAATDKSSNPVNEKHVYVVSQLKLVGADTMKCIDQLIKVIAEDKFETEYGYGDLSLPGALWISSTLLFELKRKVTKHVVLFTSRENPFKNAQDKVRTFSKVADFEKSKVTLAVYPCKEGFEKKYYEELMKIGPLQFIDETFLEVKPRHVPLANIPFYISDDYFIPITINHVSRKVSLPFERYHSKASNAPVTSKITRIKTDTETVPEIQNTLRSEVVGEKEVMFTIEEEHSINNAGERRLKLLGFKPRSTISLELHVQPSPFILPNEDAATGASNVFSTLINRCLVKDVVAICTFCPRPTSTVRYVALAPQTAVSPDHDSKDLPIGFLMIYLPFADEVRSVAECESNVAASNLQVDIMKEVVKKLKFSFDPANFPNPKLATYWAATEAIALDLNQPEQVLDYAAPNLEQQQARLAGIMEELDKGGLSCEVIVNRIAPKIKGNPSVEDLALVEEHYKNDMITKLTSAQLINYLRHIGMTHGISKMKKSDLVLRVEEYMKKAG